MGFYAILAGLFDPEHRRQIIFGLMALLMSGLQLLTLLAMSMAKR